MNRTRLGLLLACSAALFCSFGAAPVRQRPAEDAGASSRPVAALPAARELALKAEDGQAVPGWLIEAPPVGAKTGDTSWRAKGDALVLLHMFRSDHTAWEPILGELARRGITTLSIDMRGHGKNLTGPGGEDLGKRVVERDEATFRSMYKDAFAAIDWLTKAGYQPAHIGLFGASVGCSVAIDAAHRREGLGPVAVLTPGVNYLGVNSEEHLKDWGSRRLLIVSSAEEAPGGPALLVAQLERQFKQRKAKDPKAEDGVTYMVIDQSGIHGTRMFGKVEGIEATLAGWFEEEFAKLPDEAPSSRPVAPKGSR